MRGLALSGGAAKGAYQAGVMHRLALEGLSWDIVAGVSCGSINAAGMAMHVLGEELEATSWLRDQWFSLNTRDVHRRWCPFGRLSWWKKGIRNLAPLRRHLHRCIDPFRIKNSGRQLIIGAVARGTREWVEWTEVDADIIVDAVMASAAIPFAFQPQWADPPEDSGVEAQHYVDGGVRSIVPVESLVRVGCDEIDVILCQPKVLPPASKPKNPLDAGLDAVDTTGDQILRDDLTHLETSGIPFNIYRPAFPLGDGMDFSSAENRRRWEIGAGVR